MTTRAKRPSQMNRDEFIESFGDLYEHSPWVAEHCYQQGIDSRHDVLDSLAEQLAKVMLSAPYQQQLALINSHPDLAGQAALAGELTADSRGEQASAGLDQCSAEQLARFQRLNGNYQTKFGFPFIMAVKNADREQILRAFELRLQNDSSGEFNTALEQINKIARLRLSAWWQQAYGEQQ